MSKGILFDSTLCVACGECEEACATQNGLPFDDAVAEEKKTSYRKYTFVMTADDDTHMRRLCMHCVDPSCGSVCPVGAFEKTAAGPVIYDEDKCMGCRYCMVACPFGIPKYEWAEVLPGVRKCTMCHDRVSQGLQTACSDACGPEATITGDRKDLLAEAHRRIRENPDQYIDHVFGEAEVGGTAVLMLASKPFEHYGFKANYVKEPLPQFTWNALSHVPDVVTIGGVLLGGIYWISNRRTEVAAAEKRDENDKHGQ
jgi:formate dehydrogenase iron-sulfur subunit